MTQPAVETLVEARTAQVDGPLRVSSAGGLVVETVTDPRPFLAMRDEWNELLAASASNGLFLTWEWLATWWTHLGVGRQLQLYAVRDQGELIAIAPCAVSPPAIERLIPFRRLEFLGTGSVGSDYLDLIVRRGSEAQALDALAEHVDRVGLPLDLAQVNRSASSASALARELTARGWRSTMRPGDVCPYIALSGHTWPSYLASLSVGHRSNVKRRLNALQKQSDMRVELVSSESGRGPALAALLDLHRRRWQERGGSDALHTPALEAFHDEFTRRALERGWLRLFVMRLDDTPVAAIYGFRYGRRFLFYQTGFDPKHAKLGVGQVVLGLSIKHAVQEGLDEYDLLHGDERYKFDWARSVRALERIELYPPGVRGALQYGAAEAGRGLRRRARQWIMGRTACPAPAADGAAHAAHAADGAVQPAEGE